MQVSVEKLGNLERKLTIQFPAQEVDSEVDKRLQNLTKTVKLDGFRKGKVPIHEVKRRYGQSVRQEVLGDMMQRSFFEAVNEKELRPAGMPHIHPKESKEGENFEFEATFEVYPEINIPELKNLAVEKVTTTINDSDVEDTIESIRKQYIEWQPVERASRKGDQVLIDFAGTIEGKPLEKGEAKDFELELGAKSMIPGFEEGIIGAKAGDELTITPSFPQDYHAAELAGKEVTFKIKVHKVKEAKLPEIDDAFAKRLNIKEGTAEKFRNEVRTNMQRELNNVLKNRLKQNVMDALFKIASVQLPKALVDMEIEKMQEHLVQQLGGNREILNTFGDKSAELFEEQARRRVTLGLLVNEYIKQNGIKADKDKVKAHIETIAVAYEQPQDVVKWYYADKNRLAEIEALILEDEVVNKILENAKVSEKTSSFAEVMKQGRQD